MDPDFGPMTDSFDTTFQVMQTLFIVVFVVVVGLIVLAAIRARRQRAVNNAAPEVSAVARVADKRIELSGGGGSSLTPTMSVDGTYSTTVSSDSISQRHLVTFEQPGGERFELEVPANEYGLLVVGDEGSVSMKGTRYLGFTRELLR